MGQNDGKDHFFRMVPKVLVPSPYNANPMTSGQLQRLNPDMEYAFPIPPGHLAGQPWFQPQCGIGPEVYDADKDPESRQRYDRVDPIATNQDPGPMSAARIIAVAAIGVVAASCSPPPPFGGGEDPYRLRLQLPNAGGLRDDSAVVIGGIEAGKVELSLDDAQRRRRAAHRPQVRTGGARRSGDDRRGQPARHQERHPGSRRQVPAGARRDDPAQVARQGRDRSRPGARRPRQRHPHAPGDPHQRGRRDLHRPPGRLRQAGARAAAVDRRRGPPPGRLVADNHTLADLVANSEGSSARWRASAGR